MKNPFSARAKCDLCPNTVSDDPYRIVIDDIDTEFTVCDECGTLLGVMENSLQELLHDKLKSELDDESI